MGMTDNQFASYLKMLIRDLSKISNQLSQDGVDDDSLEDLGELIKSLEEQARMS